VKRIFERSEYTRQKDLAQDAELALDTVHKFLNGKSINRENFIELCHRLGIVDWQEITELTSSQISELPKLVEPDVSKLKSDSVAQKSAIAPPRIDWGEAPDVSAFYGREAELATLKNWIVTDRCRAIALLGMGGIGKTALSVRLSQEIQHEFEFAIWRSLREAPPLEKILDDVIEKLGLKPRASSTAFLAL
jgi:DNA-binding Xre family transcriptional regulator